MNNQPAFPCQSDTPPEYDGMTLRDYLAAKAMPIVFGSHTRAPDFLDHASKLAYKMADAMLKAREA